MPCPVCHKGTQVDYFADLTVREGNRDAIRYAKNWAVKPDGWLVLVGEVGTGKTRLLSAIVSTWRGQPRAALTTAELLDLWRAAMDEHNLGPVFNQYCEASRFTLDDLGVERTTDWGLERLGMFLDFRYGRALPTAIATNLTRRKMEEGLGTRVADRVYDVATGLVRVVALRGVSFRLGLP